MSRILRYCPGWVRVAIVATLLTACLSSATAFASSIDHPESLLIGIEPEHNIFGQMVRYRSLARYLSDQLGVTMNLTIMSRYGEVLKRFKSLKLDGAFLTPYTATMGIKELQLEPIANPVNLNGSSSSQGLILVRQDSGISDVPDMEGKNIVFVDQATMEGYLFPLVYLKRRGIADISHFFNRIIFSGSHASAIYTVLDGRADIAAAKSTVFSKLIETDPSIQSDLHIIAQSPKVPEITLCVKSEIPGDIRRKLSTILLQMDTSAPGREALKQFNALRFVRSDKKDFQIIEAMEQEIAPGQSANE